MLSFRQSYLALPEACYRRVLPTPVAAPEWLAVNESLARELGIDVDWLKSEEGLAVFSGNKVLEGTDPIAQKYAGHQFGNWNPQLGDGRAILLGELQSLVGAWRDVQLKGAGVTPYSRQGDGRSALGPVVREYLMSEAMHALGVPTTRALAAVRSGEVVAREEYLDGGVFARVAASHLRVGTFQYFASEGKTEVVKALMEYAVARHYPELREVENMAADFLGAVVRAQSELVAQWMSLGFIHGVMNTDNFSISGETIDFGPCAMMEEFHPHCVFSSIDRDGRYAWGDQPNIAHWNLTRLAESLLPLIAEDEEKAIALAGAELERFSALFSEAYNKMFSRKLGVGVAGSESFIHDTLALLANHSVDFTLFFSRPNLAKRIFTTQARHVC